MPSFQTTSFTKNLMAMAVCWFFASAGFAQNDLALQGIIDFTVPSGGSDGKAIHLVAAADIADLSAYGIGVANNGGGTDGQEYTFPAVGASAGDHILVARSLTAMSAYLLADCYNAFAISVEDASGAISQNGDDAIELFFNGEVIETFGDIDVDGSGQDWEYTDSWAYKVDGAWTYGVVNCTDGTTTIFDASCLYPFCEVPADIPGCTDPTAFNFNPNATVDDGSCEAVVVGCLDNGADNYDSTANTSCDDCCEFGGCTDSGALNYDPDANVDDGSCIFDNGELTNALALQGIIDFTVPEAGSSGKALHVVAVADIADLSVFGAGTANNGGGTDGIEFTFPAMSLNAGESLLIVRDAAAMTNYFSTCFGSFDHVVENGSWPDHNGDDAIELFENGLVIETFGDINVDGTGEAWEYTDSWAFKEAGTWTYGTVDCTDGTTTIFDASCVYPVCALPSGCTDPFYVEFDMMAEVDDGSCATLVVFGCLYEIAENYDSAANTDDGSCIIQQTNACPGDLDGDGLVATPDLLTFLSVFGLTCE